MDGILRHGIVYPTSDPTHRKSAIILEQNHILAPASILYDFLRNDRAILKIVQSSLVIYKIIDVSADSNITTLKLPRFNVILRNQKVLEQFDARLLYIFNSNSVSDSINMVMNGFKLIDSQILPYNDKYEDIDILHLLLSSFVVLKLQNNPSISLFCEMKITKNLISHEKLRKLDKITCISTPFGNESFFGTINEGTISNIIGQNNCLIVASMPLVFGCEGAPVYDKYRYNKLICNCDTIFYECPFFNVPSKMIGVIIMTSFKWNNEIATLSLAASLGEIFQEFLEQKNNTIRCIPRQLWNSQHKYEKCTVLIQNGSSWGTGCMLRVLNKRMIITCSHVVWTTYPNKFKCTYAKGEFYSNIIYKHSRHNQPYDVAILDVPDSIPETYFTSCEIAPAKTGQTIFSLGFPHFVTLGTALFSPSIFEGKVTKVNTGIFYTDAIVQAGQSGGPILTETGTLLGICVCNAKDGNNIYPMINMCIPIYDIYHVLEDFSRSNDSRFLMELDAGKNMLVKKLWNLEPPIVISKL